MTKVLKKHLASLPKHTKILPSENKEVLDYCIDGVYYRAYYSPVIKELIVTKLKTVTIGKQSNIPTFFAKKPIDKYNNL